MRLLQFAVTFLVIDQGYNQTPAILEDILLQNICPFLELNLKGSPIVTIIWLEFSKIGG